MAKRKAHGTQLQIGDAGSPEAFTTVAYLTDIDGPGGDTEELDATTHDSAAAESLAGFPDFGEITLDGYFDPAEDTHTGADGLATLHTSGETRNMKLVFPSGGEAATFAGWVRNFRIRAPIRDVLGFSATIRCTGPVTWP